ncbi:MAG: ubiquinol-cytochrome C reductase, partial [Actinomycetota bacterium]|nr:ubiquinol-cytochrome C reductase [Actinomycetota bacterium]
MSNEIQKFQDPGLPEHVHRKTDVDPKAADRAERQVSILFVLSALSTALAIYAYVFISDEIFFFLPI